MRTGVWLLPLGAALLLAGRAHAQADIQIVFRAAARVSGPSIRLCDVARVVCADTRLADSLGEVEVGQAPPAGGSRALAAAYARIRVRSLGLPEGRFAFAGAAMVTVTRPGQTLPGAALERAACAAAEAARPGWAAQVAAPVRDLSVSCGTVALAVKGTPRLSGDYACLTLQVSVEGRPERLVPVGVRLLARGPVVVAARTMAAGTVLAEADLRVEERPVPGGAGVLSEAGRAVGRRLAAPVAEGAPLNAGTLQIVPLIRRGDRVRVVCRGGGFAIACAAEALQEGAAGQTIRVRNTANQLEFTARVAGAGLLEVIY